MNIRITLSDNTTVIVQPTIKHDSDGFTAVYGIIKTIKSSRE